MFSQIITPNRYACKHSLFYTYSVYGLNLCVNLLSTLYQVIMYSEQCISDEAKEKKLNLRRLRSKGIGKKDIDSMEF